MNDHANRDRYMCHAYMPPPPNSSSISGGRVKKQQSGRTAPTGLDVCSTMQHAVVYTSAAAAAALLRHANLKLRKIHMTCIA